MLYRSLTVVARSRISYFRKLSKNFRGLSSLHSL